LVDVDRQRQKLVRQAFRLEWLTVLWLSVEGGVAVASGVAAHSISLTAFGLDSLELASTGILIWRLSSELRFGREVSEKAEQIAARIGGGLLFALAAYVVAAAGWSLWRGGSEAFSWPGLTVVVLAMPIMSVLARRKLALAQQLGSRPCARMLPSRWLVSDCRLSSWSAFSPNSPLAPGGSMRSPRSRSWGFSSKRGARPGLLTRMTDGRACCAELLEFRRNASLDKLAIL
jgi:hypothetical protein